MTGSDSEDSDISSMDDEGSNAGSVSGMPMPAPWISDHNHDVTQCKIRLQILFKYFILLFKYFILFKYFKCLVYFGSHN